MNICIYHKNVSLFLEQGKVPLNLNHTSFYYIIITMIVIASV